MSLSRATMLDRAKARDRSFDGRFLTGVLSTGIYCLPSCPARSPKDENVQHFSDPAAARAAGLRACRRCKPDDFYRGFDPDLERVRDVAERIRQAPAEFGSAESLAGAVGVGFTKLTKLFRDHYHVTPGIYLGRARIAAACRALVTTRRRVLNVGLDVGFESSSAFHENFRRLTGMPPGDYRRLPRGETFELALPDGYRIADPLRYLGRDSESACERVVGQTIYKTCGAGRDRAVLEMTLESSGEGQRARCKVRGKTGAASPAALEDAHEVALRLLNLRADPAQFERIVTRKLGHGRLVKGRHGARMPRAGDLFESVVWAIVGQQVNLAFAYSLRRRLVRLSGERVGNLFTHPSPARVARLDYDDLKPLQFSRRKAEYLIDVARLIAGGELDLEALGDEPVGTIRERLLAIRGFGPWTVEYVLMRGYGHLDCVPVGDAGLVAALREYYELEDRPDAALTQNLLEPFAPWRTLASFHFWQTLGD